MNHNPEFNGMSKAIASEEIMFRNIPARTKNVEEE
jgi:hypothetical protein